MKLRKNKLKTFHIDLPLDLLGGQEVCQRFKVACEGLVSPSLRQRGQMPVIRQRSECSAEMLTILLGGSEVRGSCLRRLAMMPFEMLSAYEKLRGESLLGKVFKRANRLHELVDRVVVLVSDSMMESIVATQAACCQPLWNELCRAERGSKPRILFASPGQDNDATQAVLHLLRAHQSVQAESVEERFGILLAAEGDPVLEGLFINRFLPVLAGQLELQPELLAECVTVVGEGSRELQAFLVHQGLRPDFFGSAQSEEASAEGRFGEVFSPASLLTAALLGVNLMEVLAGAWSGSQQLGLELASLQSAGFYSPHAAIAEGAGGQILPFTLSNVGFSSLERSSDAKSIPSSRPRSISFHAQGLSGFANWYRRLVEESLSVPVSRLTGTSAARCISASMAIGRSSGMGAAFHQITSSESRFDALDFGATNDLLQICSSRAERELALVRELPTPSSRITMPIVDELHFGYLAQWMLLATSLEEELLSRGF